jgi:hypothetical protein
LRLGDGVLPPDGWVQIDGYDVQVFPPKRKVLSENRRCVARCLHDKLNFTSVIMIDPDDPATQVHGLKKRLLRRLPDPVSILEDWNGVDRNSFCEHFAPMGRAWVVRMQRIMKARLRRFVQLWAHHNVEPLTREPDFDEWLERGTWTRSQKDRMRKEWAEKYHSTLPPVNKSASVAPFVKAECYRHSRRVAGSTLRMMPSRWRQGHGSGRWRNICMM